jgi:hypothetical protein
MTAIASRVVVILAALIIGNYLGDQKTLLDCAVAGSAKMLGSGSITCAVVWKDVP